jgi:uncharacterized protein YxeA
MLRILSGICLISFLLILSSSFSCDYNYQNPITSASLSDTNTSQTISSQNTPTNSATLSSTKAILIPRAPVNASATATSQYSITIEWLDNSDNEDGFKIYRGNTLVGSVSANSQTYIDNGLEEGKTYQYAIKAFIKAGESAATTCSATTRARPVAPDNLKADSITSSNIQINWNDNSNNEDGFNIYRDGSLIGTVENNIKSYSDKGLRQATQYTYVVRAYNDSGESNECTGSFKTLNPPLKITLERVGVYENGEVELRGKGEVYVIIGIVDREKSIQLRLPHNENQFYSLNKNEVTNVNEIIYSTKEIGENFDILFLGYESDGGDFEQRIYNALATALDNYLTGGAVSGLADLFNISLGNIVGNFFGVKDDFLGVYEIKGNKNNNWGKKSYKDITLKDQKGVHCLRLWFTIE